MTDSQLDEIFKKQLPAHESLVPEDMWDRIIRKNDRDRKGFFFFFTLIGLFILGFVTAGILLFDVNKKEIVGEKHSISDSNIVSSTKNAQSATTNRVAQKDSSLNNEVPHGRSSNLHMLVMHKDHVKNTMSSAGRQAAILQSNEKAKNKSVENSQKKSNTDSVSELSGIPDSKNSSKTSEDSSKLSDQKANPAISSPPKVLTTDSAKNSAVKKQDSTKNIIGKKWSLDLYASPDLPVDYGEPYVKSKLSYTVGFRVNHSFGKWFSGTIGIQFSKLNYGFIDSMGFSSTGHLKSLDLPVLAGYSWGNANLGMTINTGVIFNLYSWSRDDSSRYSASYFKTNTGLSLYLGLHLEKQINERLSIFTEPYYRYRLNSMTVSTVYFLKFIDVAGLTFGVRYYLK